MALLVMIHFHRMNFCLDAAHLRTIVLLQDRKELAVDVSMSDSSLLEVGMTVVSAERRARVVVKCSI